jgi:hypothetical protein
MEWIKLSEKWPDKGIDIEYIEDGMPMGFAYRCACHNKNCKEWRESITGYGLMINPTKWRYVSKQEVL